MGPGLRAEALIMWQGDEARRQVLVQCDGVESFYRFPGGSIEIGETAAAAIRRELREEFALALEVGALAAVYEAWDGHARPQWHHVTLLHWAVAAEQTGNADVRWHQEHPQIKLVWRTLAELRQSGTVTEGILRVLEQPGGPVAHLRQGFDGH